MKVAIIGAGISGLVTAHLLAPEHDLIIFEAGDYPGGHTNTVDVELDGQRLAVDTGFIVFNELNYPNFVRLLDDLGVASQPSSMSFSVRCDQTGLEYNGTSLNRLFAQRRNLFRPWFHRMVADILRFNREAPKLLSEDAADLTVEAFLAEGRYGPHFAEHYLVPMGSAIWSCPAQRFREFPIRFVVEFFDHHRMLSVSGRPLWRVIKGGSRSYVQALIRPFANRIRLGCAVRAVSRHSDAVEIIDSTGRTERFDQVILACHADQALALLQDPSPLEREVLSSFPYQENEAVLHTDASVLPRRRRAWAAWNYHRRAGRGDSIAVTYNMNILQSLPSEQVVCVTLNEEQDIDPRRVIDRFTYHHPVYTARGVAARQRHHELIDVNRTSYCGAYWGYGFHEDGVNSALAVSRAFGRTLCS